jgi:hypothetical protein
MVTRHVHHYVVSCTAELVLAEDAIGSTSEPVFIEANADSGVLVDIEDFRCLAAAARVAGTSVTFGSDDPLRRELARIVGLQVEEPEPVVSGVRRAIGSNAPTRKIERVEPQPVLPPMIDPVPSLSEALSEYTGHPEDESYASFSFVVNPPVPRRPGRMTENWTYQSGSVATTWPAGRKASRRMGKAAGIATLIALALLVASSAIMVALIAPQATITLVPATSLISADVSYGIAGQAEHLDVTIQPVQVTGETSFTVTIPTTGTRSEPDGYATGELLLTNPLTSEGFLPAGSTFATASGVTFTTLEDVVIPAADPFGSLTMGSALTPIQAVAPGPDSNVAAQSLSGQLASGLFYSNRDETWGGTMREIPTVAEADVQTLRALATDGLTSQHQTEIAALVPPGQELVTGSTTFGDVQFSVNPEPGVDATEVSVVAVQALSAQVYDPEELHRLAADELNRRLTGSIPRENVLLADSVSKSDPSVIPTESGNPEYRMSASARTRMVLDPSVVAALKSDLVGVSEDEAASKVALVRGVARFDIEYGPEWFPLNWPPRLESRIAINIDDRAATETASGATRP